MQMSLASLCAKQFTNDTLAHFSAVNKSQTTALERSCRCHFSVTSTVSPMFSGVYNSSRTTFIHLLWNWIVFKKNSRWRCLTFSVMQLSNRNTACTENRIVFKSVHYTLVNIHRVCNWLQDANHRVT